MADNSVKLRKIVKSLSWFMAIVGALSLALIIVIITINVVKREVTGKDLFAVTNFGELLIVITTFFGLAWTQLKGGHVSCAVLFDCLPKRWQRVFEFIVAFISLFFALILLWASTESAIDAYLGGETAFVSGKQLAIWRFRWALPIGIVFYVAVLLYNLKDSFFDILTKGER